MSWRVPTVTADVTWYLMKSRAGIDKPAIMRTEVPIVHTPAVLADVAKMTSTMGSQRHTPAFQEKQTWAELELWSNLAAELWEEWVEAKDRTCVWKVYKSAITQDQKQMRPFWKLNHSSAMDDLGTFLLSELLKACTATSQAS